MKKARGDKAVLKTVPTIVALTGEAMRKLPVVDLADAKKSIVAMASIRDSSAVTSLDSSQDNVANVYGNAIRRLLPN